MKCLILVLASSAKHYTKIEDTIRQTWLNYIHPDVKTLFYKDNNNETEQKKASFLRNDELILPCKDGFFSCGVKTILCFEYVLKHFQFDYIYRSNLGAYVIPNNIIRFLEDKPKEKFYCGIIGNDNYYLKRNVRFASGSGYFLSRDLVEIIVKNKTSWKHHIIDDVALGELLSSFNIKIDERATRVSITDDVIAYERGDREVEKLDKDEIYHLRLRSTKRKYDIRNMKILYNTRWMPDKSLETTIDLEKNIFLRLVSSFLTVINGFKRSSGVNDNRSKYL